MYTCDYPQLQFVHCILSTNDLTSFPWQKLSSCRTSIKNVSVKVHVALHISKDKKCIAILLSLILHIYEHLYLFCTVWFTIKTSAWITLELVHIMSHFTTVQTSYLQKVPSQENPIILGCQWLRVAWKPSKQLVWASGESFFISPRRILLASKVFSLS